MVHHFLQEQHENARMAEDIEEIHDVAAQAPAAERRAAAKRALVESRFQDILRAEEVINQLILSYQS